MVWICTTQSINPRTTHAVLVSCGQCVAMHTQCVPASSSSSSKPRSSMSDTSRRFELKSHWLLYLVPTRIVAMATTPPALDHPHTHVRIWLYGLHVVCITDESNAGGLTETRPAAVARPTRCGWPLDAGGPPVSLSTGNGMRSPRGVTNVVVWWRQGHWWCHINRDTYLYGQVTGRVYMRRPIRSAMWPPCCHLNRWLFRTPPAAYLRYVRACARVCVCVCGFIGSTKNQDWTSLFCICLESAHRPLTMVRRSYTPVQSVAFDSGIAAEQIQKDRRTGIHRRRSKIRRTKKTRPMSAHACPRHCDPMTAIHGTKPPPQTWTLPVVSEPSWCPPPTIPVRNRRPPSTRNRFYCTPGSIGL